jgi:hypothetical protein
VVVVGAGEAAVALGDLELLAAELARGRPACFTETETASIVELRDKMEDARKQFADLDRLAARRAVSLDQRLDERIGAVDRLLAERQLPQGNIKPASLFGQPLASEIIIGGAAILESWRGIYFRQSK